MKLPLSEELEIRNLNRIFDNKSESYKLFWFNAIVSKVLEGGDIFTYDELINEMVADAWYMVSEYHLNLGPSDSIEKAVKYVNEISSMRPGESREEVLKFLEECDDRKLRKIKNVLGQNVPYRLQAPFLKIESSGFWNVSKKELAGRINQQKRLMYYFEAFNGMNTAIRVQPEWCAYIRKNGEILKGWIRFNMITYLQKRNPSVPGIASKLYPPQERNMKKARDFWKTVTDIEPVREIYSGELVEGRNISIDHFVPWSYVAHDELWNLNPTTRSINSSKSNSLPEWNIYFPELCRLEYDAYCLIWENEKVHKQFESCAGEHLNDEEIRRRLYRKGMSCDDFSNELESVIMPVYKAARNMGFREWRLGNGRNDA